MTATDHRISKLIELFVPIIFCIPLFTQTITTINFIRQPKSIAFVFSIFPSSVQNSTFFFTLFLLFEYWSKVLFMSGTVWMIQMNLLPAGWLSLWARTLMKNPVTTVNGHIRYYKLLGTTLAQMSATVGKLFLPLVVYSLGGNCVILTFASIKFFGKMESSNYMFFFSSALVTLAVNQALLYVNGSIYDMSRKYLKLIKRKIPLGRSWSTIEVKKVVRSLRYAGVPLGSLPCTKSEYAIRASYEIFNNVVNLLIAFQWKFWHLNISLKGITHASLIIFKWNLLKLTLLD